MDTSFPNDLQPEMNSDEIGAASSSAPLSLNTILDSGVAAPTQESEASDSEPAPTEELTTSDDGIIHVTKKVTSRSQLEWFEERAYPNLPTGLPATFRQFWKSAYLGVRDSKKVVRERKINNKTYIYHEQPTVAEVMHAISNALLGFISQRLESLEKRVEEFEDHARKITWAQLLAVARCNLLEFLLIDDIETKMKATFKVYDMVIKLSGGKEKEALSNALLESEGEKLDTFALVRDFQEKLARQRDNTAEEESPDEMAFNRSPNRRPLQPAGRNAVEKDESERI